MFSEVPASSKSNDFSVASLTKRGCPLAWPWDPREPLPHPTQVSPWRAARASRADAKGPGQGSALAHQEGQASAGAWGC